jgi:hypothetical protein
MRASGFDSAIPAPGWGDPQTVSIVDGVIGYGPDGFVPHLSPEHHLYVIGLSYDREYICTRFPTPNQLEIFP